MNPRLRSKGLGKHFLLAAIDCYEMERDTVLFARIKNENEGRKKIFAHAGFTVSQEGDATIVVEHWARDDKTLRTWLIEKAKYHTIDKRKTVNKRANKALANLTGN